MLLRLVGKPAGLARVLLFLAHMQVLATRKKNESSAYLPRSPRKQALYRLLQDHLETVLTGTAGPIRVGSRRILESYIECGVGRFGLARLKCCRCGDEIWLPLSCRGRGICPSCHARRQLLTVEFLLEEVFPDVACRQWTFGLPRVLRKPFLYERDLFRELSGIVARTLFRYIRYATGHGDLEAGCIVADQTFGTLPDDFHPHLHVCALDGGYLPDGSFVRLREVRTRDLRQVKTELQHRTLELFEKKARLTSEFKRCMLSWEHSGFSLDASRRVRGGDRKGLERLLMYMTRHPFNPGAIDYDSEAGRVVYRAHRRHRGRNTDRIEMSAVDFIMALERHIPHPRKHQIRYYGACHAKVRERLGLKPKKTPQIRLPGPRFRGPAFNSEWARLIWKVYGVNPLECPHCGGERRLIAVVMNDASLVRILKHYGEPTELPFLQPARAPPIEDSEVCQLDMQEHFEGQGKTGHTEPQRPQEKPKTPKTLEELLARGLVYFAGEKEKNSEE